ncbi:MAG: hypothetical protein KTR29_19855 [Rhodothermaceae bacterium]|nr:hypothetical protein [Rhodothermaceae bacterium]
MLGSQLNALEPSTSYRTPYSLESQSQIDDSIKEEMVKKALPSQENGKDAVILDPNTLARLDASNETKSSTDTSEVGPDGKEFTPEEEKEIEKLKDRDREVRRHEQAHFQAAGNYASPPKYEYQTGPDGKRYAIGGSVEIDMSAVTDDPEATLNKARVIKRAALAPEEPSAQDRKVAREADRMATQAQKEITEQRMNSAEALVHGESAIQEASFDQNIEQPREISAPKSVKSPTETLEASVENIKGKGVSQYKTSQLEMSASQVYRVERLATPGKAELYSPSLLKFDMYA